jgi:hypothetical protein
MPRLRGDLPAHSAAGLQGPIEVPELDEAPVDHLEHNSHPPGGAAQRPGNEFLIIRDLNLRDGCLTRVRSRLPRLIGSLFHRPDGFLIDSVCSGTQHVYESFLIFSEAESTRSLTWE